MTLDPSPRSDLADNGTFVPEQKSKGRSPRGPIRYLTGDALTVDDGPSETTFYDLKGNPTAEASTAVAKQVDGVAFVKAGTTGSVRGQLIDPRGPFFKESDPTAWERTAGRPRYDYVRVSGGVLMKYLAYLRRGSVNLLREAEREVNNG